MARKKAPGSLPESVKSLYKAGQRIRFHGGWLGESEMDRTIAGWLDDLPARDAWPVIKTILYTYITGRMMSNIDAPQMASSTDEFGALSQALLDLDD